MPGDPQRRSRSRVADAVFDEDDRADEIARQLAAFEQWPRRSGLESGEAKMTVRVPLENEIHGAVAEIADPVEEHDRRHDWSVPASGLALVPCGNGQAGILL